jgi:prepilin-type N-terminal cleavage/methylation domain-containing protein
MAYYNFVKNKKGFTLVEVLVSLFVFSIVVAVALGLFVIVSGKVKMSRAERRVTDNISFALEHLSRSIAYGRNFACGIVGTSATPVPVSCPISVGGDDTVSFTGIISGTRSTITYKRLVNTATGRGYIGRSINSEPFVSLTDEAIDVEELKFYVSHALPFVIDPEQPIVTIVLKGVSYATPGGAVFIIQTTVSQRDLKL